MYAYPLTCQHAHHFLSVLCRHPQVIDKSEACHGTRHYLSRHGIDNGQRVRFRIVPIPRIKVKRCSCDRRIVLSVVDGDAKESLPDALVEDIGNARSDVAEHSQVGDILINMRATLLLNLYRCVYLVANTVAYAAVFLRIYLGVAGIATAAVGDADRDRQGFRACLRRVFL